MTAYNGVQAISSTTYTQIGTGPCRVTLTEGANPVSIIVSDTVPAASARGTDLTSSNMSVDITVTSAVWAISTTSVTGYVDVIPKVITDSGTDPTGVSQPTGGVGVRGWLGGIYNALTNGILKTQATVNGSNISAANPIPTSDVNVGIVATGVSQPAGGTGILGMLSGIYNNLLTLITIMRPYSTLMDSTSTAGYTYVCEALPGTLSSAAAWRIQRIDSTGSVMWANGGAFTSVADNRASLTYAY